MPLNIFFHSGSLIYKLRWVILIAWVAVVMACLPYASQVTAPFKEIGFKDFNSQSAKANKLMNDTVGYSYNSFIIMYTGDSFKENPTYLDDIKKSLKDLKKFPIEHKIIYPTDKNNQISPDKKSAYVVVLFNSNKAIDKETLQKFRELIKPVPKLDIKVGGEPVFLQDTKSQTQKDLYSTEYFATPVAIITMLIVFGSVIAGLIPIVLGAISAFLMLMLLFLLGHYYTLSVFTINISLLLGLILSLDYALLIVSRFKEELKTVKNVVDAIAITQATAVKSVFFSGLAVFISLSALLLFPINILSSVGIGGLAAVSIAMLTNIILLPAILAILNYRINWLSIPFLYSTNNRQSVWRWLVEKVVRFPFIFFITILVLLISLGYPFLHAKIGISDFRILPKGLESREVFDVVRSKYGENKLDPIYLVIESKNKKILTKSNIAYLYDLASKIKKDPMVKEVKSIVYTNPRMKKSEYQMMYTTGYDRLPDNLKDYIDITTKDKLTIMTVESKHDPRSEENKQLIEKLRNIKIDKNFTLKITGGSVNTLDVKESIMKTFPKAFLFIVIATYFTLLLFLRSVILPLKAIFTTILSLFASYGVLVLVFQMGYLHEFLNFDPQGILDITLLIIIFCALFGVSMDYEVFLLTRIREYYEKGYSNNDSIIYGIQYSSKIISSAAIIVIVICFAFMAADVLIVKAFGLGIAVAVFVDAFIIRILFVPATMALLGKLNWYLPRWLDMILPYVSFDPDHLYKPGKTIKSRSNEQ